MKSGNSHRVWAVLAGVLVVSGGRAVSAADNTGPRPSIQPEFVTYHGDPGLSGYVATSVPARPVSLWRYKTSGAVRETPVIGGGRIYYANRKSEIGALDLKGTKLWTVTLLHPPTPDNPTNLSPDSVSIPMVLADNVLVLAAESGKLYGLDAATGATKWTYDTGAHLMGAPTIVTVTGKGRAVVVISQADGILHCVSIEKGEKIWVSEPTNRCDGSPAAAGGKIAYGNCDSAIHVFSADDGKLEKSIGLGADSQVAGGVAMVGGFVYSGNRSGSLVAADIAKGETAWESKEGSGELFTTPAVGPDRVVYAAGDGNIYAVDRAKGAKLWVYESGKIGVQSPVIAGDKVIATVDGALVLLNLADGKKIESINISDSVTSPAVAGGLIVVGTGEGHIIALGEEKKP